MSSFDSLSSSPKSSSPPNTRLKSLLSAAVQHHLDPWAKHEVHKLPAERVRRHRYLPQSGSWLVDESLVKIEAKPFDSGAMRNVYRMKKLSQVHLSTWSKPDWRKAPNYVAKSYKTADGNWDSSHRSSYFADVKLQYEAAHWAAMYNKARPPKQIEVIQCFVLEFFERPGCPVLGCERFVDGHDKYGAGFVKHNSNSGYVESHEARLTPQAFTAFSFYSSEGSIMVVDIQGVGDLYTDPQVHSIDNRFGDGDLGCRGMALFFATFRRNGICDFLGLPRFPLSKNQSNRIKNAASRNIPCELSQQYHEKFPAPPPDDATRGFQSVLLPPVSPLSPPLDSIDLANAVEVQDGEEFDLGKGDRSASMRRRESVATERRRIKSETDFKSLKLLQLAGTDEGEEAEGSSCVFSVHLSGEELEEIHQALKTSANEALSCSKGCEEEVEGEGRGQTGEASPPHSTFSSKSVVLSESLKRNLGRVHFELARLHAVGRFSDSDEASLTSTTKGPEPDISSCLVHLCHASLLGHRGAALSLGLLHHGRETTLLAGLTEFVKEHTTTAAAFYALAAQRGSLSGACLGVELCSDMKRRPGLSVEARTYFESSELRLCRLALDLISRSTPPILPETDQKDALSMEAISGASIDIMSTAEAAAATGTVTTLTLPELSSCEPVFVAGEDVEANYLKSGSWRFGQIARVHAVDQIDSPYETSTTDNVFAVCPSPQAPSESVSGSPVRSPASYSRGDSILYTVRYDDGIEELTHARYVRKLTGERRTMEDEVGARMVPVASNAEAMFTLDNTDDEKNHILPTFQLQARLAELNIRLAESGDCSDRENLLLEAYELYTEAAEGAMAAGKVSVAMKYTEAAECIEC